MPVPRTHYQISMTARQAVGVFLGLLVSLAVAYFLGLKTGLAGRPESGTTASHAAPAPTPAAQEAASEALPPIETAVPTAAAAASASGSPGGSRTLLAGASAPTPPPAEPTTLQTFEDSSADEPAPVAGAAPPPAKSAARTDKGERADRPAPGTYWVQVASLSSKDEAGALSSRLSKHGFRAQVATAAGAKGKGKVYRVRVGPYRSEEDAGRAAAKLAKQENVKSPWVVPEGK